MKKLDRNKEISLQIDEYRKKLRKMKKKMVRERKPTPYERTRDAVYATGNKWGKENIDITHN